MSQTPFPSSMPGKAAPANAETNCLTEIIIPSVKALLHAAEHKPDDERPVAGVPVSLKGMIDEAGYVTSIGAVCGELGGGI